MTAHLDPVNAIVWHKQQIVQMEVHIKSLNKLLLVRTNRDLSVEQINIMLKEAAARLNHMYALMPKRGRKYRKYG